MKKCLCASHLMKEFAILFSQVHLLPVAMHASGVMALIANVFERCVSGIGERVLAFKSINQEQSFMF